MVKPLTRHSTFLPSINPMGRIRWKSLQIVTIWTLETTYVYFSCNIIFNAHFDKAIWSYDGTVDRHVQCINEKSGCEMEIIPFKHDNSIQTMYKHSLLVHHKQQSHKLWGTHADEQGITISFVFFFSKLKQHQPITILIIFQQNNLINEVSEFLMNENDEKTILFSVVSLTFPFRHSQELQIIMGFFDSYQRE